MIEWLVGLAVLFFLGAVFYKQSIQEFRLNQIEWDQRHSIDGLFDERVPLIVRGIPPCPVWTQEDIMIRDFYGQERAPGDKRTIRDIVLAPEGAAASWSPSFRRHLFGSSGAELWFDGSWAPVVAGQRGWLAKLLPTIGQCYFGAHGLTQVKANWQLIVPTEGAIVVSIMTSRYQKYLPQKWQGMFLNQMSKKNVPFVDELKYVDIIVRPGTAVWIPAHWFISWSAKDEGMQPLVVTVNLHNPISYLVGRGT